MSQDLANLIIIFVAQLLSCSSQPNNEPLLPLSSMDELDTHEDGLRDDPRYAQLVERWLLQDASNVQQHITNTRVLVPRIATLNWRGINEKGAFGSTRLAQGLIYASAKKFPDTYVR